MKQTAIQLAMILALTLALGVAGLVCLLGPLIRFAGSIPSESEVRQRVESVTSLVNLQQRTAEWLERDSASDALPDFARALGANWMSAIEESKDVPPHAWIEMGGGFYHYGLRIGPPGFVPPHDATYRFAEWTDGVWYHEQIAP